MGSLSIGRLAKRRWSAAGPLSTAVSFSAGPMVRIRFPPSASPTNSGSAAFERHPRGDAFATGDNGPLAQDRPKLGFRCAERARHMAVDLALAYCDVSERHCQLSRPWYARCVRYEPKVCRLTAGASRIRTLSVPLACGHTRALPLGVGLGGNPNYLISLAARTLPLRDIMRMSEDDAMRASSPFASLATTASRSARTEGS